MRSVTSHRCIQAMTWALLACGLLPFAGAANADQPAEEQSSLPVIHQQLQEGLADRLGQSSQGEPREYQLELEGAWLHHAVAAQVDPTGIRKEDGTLSLIHDGKDWQRASIGTTSDELGRRLLAKVNDWSGLSREANDVKGTIQASAGRVDADRDFGEGENMHSMLKAQRKPVINWHVGGIERVRQTPLTIDLEFKLIPQRWVLELELDDFAGEERKPSIPAADDSRPVNAKEGQALIARSRRPIQIELAYEKGKWSLLSARTPSWNRALHRVDASNLKLKDGKLTGEMKVKLLPDPWVPSGGARRQREIVCQIEARISEGYIEGKYQAKGDQGTYQSQLKGKIWQAVEGSYVAKGIDGEMKGLVWGKSRELPGSMERIEALNPNPLPDLEGVDLTEAVAKALNHYREIHALLLVNKHLPIEGDRRLNAALWMPQPIMSADAAKAFMDDLTRFARANSGNHHAAMGDEAEPIDKQFGPYFGGQPIQGNTLPKTVNQTGKQLWGQLPRWQILGPIEKRGSQDWFDAVLPPVMPTEGVTYAVGRTKLEGEIVIKRAWRDVEDAPEVIQPDSEDWRDTFTRLERFPAYSNYPANLYYYSQQNDRRSYRWYAKSNVESPQAQKVWLAMRMGDFGRLWVNGKLAWSSTENHDPRRIYLVPVELQKGANELFIEVTKRHITYHAPVAWDRSHLSVWVNTQGQPRDSAEIQARENQLAARYQKSDGAAGYFTPGAREYADASPPMTWNLKHDRNVTWTVDLGEGSSPPVLSDGKLYVLAEPGMLYCIDAKSGKTVWQQTLHKDEDLPLAANQVNAAPVVIDGKVYVTLGNGAVFCFTVTGEQVWAKQTDLRWTGDERFSPLVVGDRLICLGTVDDPKNRKSTQQVAIALGLSDGDLLWESQAFSNDAPGINAVELFEDDHARFALVSPAGDVLDASDGKIVARDLFSLNGPTVPVVDRDIAYFVGERNGQAAIRFWIDDAGRISFRKLWEIRRAGSSSHQVTTHGIVSDGLLYLVRTTDESGGHHPIAWDQLDVYEVARGQHLARPNPAIADTNTPLPAVKAGKYLVVSDKGLHGREPTPPRATIAYVAMGDRPYVVTREDFGDEKLKTAPVFDGPRMFVRVGKQLVCIGSDDKDQQLQDTQAALAFALGEIGYTQQREMKTYQSLQVEESDSLPVSTVESGIMPEHWLALGPIPLGMMGNHQVVDDLAGEAISVDQRVELAGKTFSFHPLQEEAMETSGMVRVYRSDGEYYRVNSKINVNLAAKKQENSRVYFYTLLKINRTMHLQYKCLGAQSWLTSKKIESGSDITLKPGFYPLLVSIDVNRYPPVGMISVQPVFYETVSADKQQSDWLNRIRIRQELLQQGVKLLGEQGVGIRAKQMLESLSENRELSGEMP